MTCLTFPPASEHAPVRVAAAPPGTDAVAAVADAPPATRPSTRAPPASTASGLRDRRGRSGFSDRGVRVTGASTRQDPRPHGSGQATVGGQDHTRAALLSL